MRWLAQTGVALTLAIALAAIPRDARADDPPATAPAGPVIAPTSIDLEKDKESGALATTPEAPPEAPPPPPYKATVVIDSSLGALLFLGKFGKTAPPAPWIRTQVGYEIFKWLMAFGEGELAFTDTSRSQDPPKTRAFPIFGFGGGARFTARFTDRFGAYLQGSVGAMKADIRTNALGIIGFKDAESLGIYFAGRLGLEWYQLDRHFGLGLTSGLRDATGFKRRGGASDTPLAFDAGASIRYAF
ncbi:MAG TPA: hypothetical protein VLT33_44935 [Labilithrix sp.]|nr:hypothetical protein [Labilithrix sp.]